LPCLRQEQEVISFKTSKMITHSQIEGIICDGEGIPATDLLINTRKTEVVFCRQLIWYFSKKYTKDTLARMTSYYGKDHASASHGIKTIKNLCDSDKIIRGKVKEYNNQIKIINDFQVKIIVDEIRRIKEQLLTLISNNEVINYEQIAVYNRLIPVSKDNPDLKTGRSLESV
jgi:hypothetical protein